MATKFNYSNDNNNHPPHPLVRVKEEYESAPLQSAPYQNPKGEPQDLLIIQQQEEEREPQFIKYVGELGSLSTAILNFKSRFDELQKHLDFIQKAIDSKFNDSSPSPQPQQHQQQQQQLIVAELPAILPVIANETETETETAKQRSSRSNLQYLCEMMCSRDLRKYILTHLSDTARLREEAPAALKCAPKPAKLVLNSIGRFFLQGKKAYNKDSPMIPAREAAVLVLEFFLLMMGDSGTQIEIEQSIKEEAELDAVSWRKRLISEGGVSKACEIDARGLLLFVACFGIPAVFSNEDVMDLIRMSNSREISDVLRRSRVLAAKIPDVIGGMIKNGKQVEAVDVAYTFGLEERFPPQKILTSFLQKSKEAWKRTREAHNSPMVLKDANAKKLAALKSVIKCMEDHKIDPTILLPGWRIKEEIISLEKEIVDLNKKMEDKIMPKRKADEIEPSNIMKSQEAKRLRFTGKGSLKRSPPVIRSHEQRGNSHADGKSSYDGLVPNLLHSGFSAHVNSYPTASSVPHGSGGGPLPENVLGTIVGGGGVHAAGVGGGLHAAGVGVLPTGSYAGVHREMMNNNSLPYGLHRVGDAAYNDRSIGKSFAGQPASMGIDGLYRPSPSIEGFVGRLDFPSTSAAKWSSSSDLYHFADAVMESESYNSSSSHKAGPFPPVVPAHHSSYMY